MKAFLMAAGKGTRLRPFTDDHPKCLIPVHGKPLLGIWLDLLAAHGITDVLINTHHHSDQVERFVSETRPHTPMALHTVYESELLGSAGTVWENRTFMDGQRDFLIAYADNLTNLDLSRMVDAHRRSNTAKYIVTMALMRAPNPGQCGIATLDSEHTITQFIEKPEHPESDLANAGIYIVSKEIYDVMEDHAGGEKIWDLGHHILPLLAGRMRGFHIAPYYLKDIGTPEAYQTALAQWPVPTVGRSA
jgi:mannose-1-phosphate guanylyltransferase